MKTGFASGNGKALQIGWKRRRNISPIYIQIDGLLSIKLDITLYDETLIIYTSVKFKICSTLTPNLTVFRVHVSGTLPRDRCWGGERARRV